MLPLPEGFTSGEVVFDRVQLGELDVARAGLSARAPSGEEITGSAAGDDARLRASCELLERAAIVEAMRRAVLPAIDEDGRRVGEVASEEVFPESAAPDRWRFARSSGVALHASLAEAAARARWELVERDRVLRAWYGELDPRSIALPRSLERSLGAVTTHAWRAASFDEPAPGWSAGVEVVGVFGFPLTEGRPLVAGFAARGDLEGAAHAAGLEALQQLAFLWDEEALASRPALGPTALHHLEHQLWPGSALRLRAFLDRGHGRFAPPRAARPEGPVELVDLSPSWLPEGLHVVRASCRAAVPLTFGDSPLAAHLPPELRSHPIA